MRTIAADRRAEWRAMLAANATLVAEVETGLRGTGVTAAQAMAWADANQMEYRQAVSLLALPTRLAQPAGAVALTDLRRAAAGYAEHGLTVNAAVPRSWDRGSAFSERNNLQFARLSEASTRLGTALTSLDLEWARQLVDVVADGARQVAADDTAPPDLKRTAAETVQDARQRYGAEVDRRAIASGATTLEQTWLNGSSDYRGPTPSELAQVTALLRHHGVPESYVESAAPRVWSDIRRTAKAEADLFSRFQRSPQDVNDGRYTRESLAGRHASTAGFARYLQGDAAAFQRVADIGLNPRIASDRQAADAANGGVLRTAQLESLRREPDAARKVQLATSAYQAFNDRIASDWSGAANPARPAYRDFVAFISSREGIETFRDVSSARGLVTKARTFEYKAAVLDFVRQVELQAGLAGSAPVRASRDTLLQARRDVEQQIALIEQRGVSFSAASDPMLSTQARQLLGQLLGKLDAALGGGA